MDLEILITGGIGILTTIMGSWSGWFFARKKYNSEVDNNLIQNMQLSLDFYKKLVDDNTKRLEEVLHRNQELENRIDELLVRNDSLENEVSTMRKQMFDMMSNICLDLSCAVRMRDLNSKRKPKREIKNEEAQSNVNRDIKS